MNSGGCVRDKGEIARFASLFSNTLLQHIILNVPALDDMICTHLTAIKSALINN